MRSRGFDQFLTRCGRCGGRTTRTYARAHGNQCKPCVDGDNRRRDESAAERRQALLIDSGHLAVAIEEDAL